MKSKILVGLILLWTIFPINLSSELYSKPEIFNLSKYRNIFTEATTTPNQVKLNIEPLKGEHNKMKNNSWICPYLINIKLDNDNEENDLDDDEPIELIFD